MRQVSSRMVRRIYKDRRTPVIVEDNYTYNVE